MVITREVLKFGIYKKIRRLSSYLAIMQELVLWLGREISSLAVLEIEIFVSEIFVSILTILFKTIKDIPNRFVD